jgi:ribosome maturation factor RimP
MSGRGRSSPRPDASRTSRDAASRGGARGSGGGRRYAGREPGSAGLDLAARRERVRDVVEPVVTAAGYDLEELTLSRAGRRQLVRVVVDGDGVSLDDIADVSRAVSAALDAAEDVAGELFAGEYALEVGSPGVDRPLTLPRHWRRNVSRLVAVRIRSAGGADRQVTGRVLGADDAGVVLDVAGVPRELAYDQLGPGRVQIEFTRWGEVADADPREPDDPGKDPADDPEDDPEDDPDELHDEDLEGER